MASLLFKGDSYYCQFYYLGRRFTVTIGEVGKDEAEDFAGSVGQLLRRIKQKLIRVPAGVAITDFILAGGQVTAVEEAAAPLEIASFADFKKKYLDIQGIGSMEDNSLGTVRMHLTHFERTFGEKFPLPQLTLADLQRHVTERAKKKYRGKPLSSVTLKKEMSSLRAAWNWAAHTGLVKGAFPSKGLVYPKADEKPPFMTWQEIESKLHVGMTEKERAELWDCLYLTRPELDELLEFVKGHAAHPWVYPLFCFVGHTGCRRSEALRVLVSDVDFAGGTVVIREKKRSRKQRTTRRVPLTPFLASVLKQWLAIHPGGPALFCHAGEVMRSKKAQPHDRAPKREGAAVVTEGEDENCAEARETAARALTKDEVHDHFKRTLAASKWDVLRGYHLLRHTFISICASRGVDQRLIDEWVGHQTEEQRRRYRHLFPSTQKQAIASAFDG